MLYRQVHSTVNPLSCREHTAEFKKIINQKGQSNHDSRHRYPEYYEQDSAENKPRHVHTYSFEYYYYGKPESTCCYCSTHRALSSFTACMNNVGAGWLWLKYIKVYFPSLMYITTVAVYWALSTSKKWVASNSVLCLNTLCEDTQGAVKPLLLLLC